MPQPETEPGILDDYFTRDSAVHRVFNNARDGFITGIMKRKLGDEKDIIDTKNAIRIKEKGLDASTHILLPEIADLTFQGEDKRLILLINGIFSGESGSLESTLARDITNIVHNLFKKSSLRTTIDQLVTEDQAKTCIKENEDLLKKAGYNLYKIISSFFIYINESDFDNFSERGRINMSKLVSFLPSCPHFLLDRIIRPEFSDYVSMISAHTTSRLKKSLVEKILKIFAVKEGSIVTRDGPLRKQGIKTIIGDWSAIKILFDNIKELYTFYEFFKSSPEIKNSKIQYLYTKRDFYKYPEDNKYGGIHILVQVLTKGFAEPTVREIQLVDKNQILYFMKEILKERTYKRGEERLQHSSGEYKALRDHYRPKLEKLFGLETIEIPF